MLFTACLVITIYRFFCLLHTLQSLFSDNLRQFLFFQRISTPCLWLFTLFSDVDTLSPKPLVAKNDENAETMKEIIQAVTVMRVKVNIVKVIFQTVKLTTYVLMRTFGNF